MTHLGENSKLLSTKRLSEEEDAEAGTLRGAEVAFAPTRSRDASFIINTLRASTDTDTDTDTDVYTRAK